jgi:hypothetical protein
MNFWRALKLIKENDDSEILSDEEKEIKNKVDISDYESSEESKNFLIHSPDVIDILEGIIIKEDAKMLHSYILGYREISDVEKILNMLPFEDDREKITTERAQRDLAKKIKSNKKKDKDKKLNHSLLLFLIILVISSPILGVAYSSKGYLNDSASEKKSSLSGNKSEILCGKEIRSSLSDVFEKKNDEIKSCKTEDYNAIVRVRARIIPSGDLNDIVIDSDVKTSDEFIKCIHSKLNSIKFRRVCESVIINKTFYM